MPRVLDGAAIAAAIKQEVAEEVRALAAQGVRPGLAAVLVGHVPASEIYVRSKVQTLRRTGPLQRPDHAARDCHHRRDARPGDCAQCARRDRRHTDPVAAAEAGGCEGAARCGVACQGRGWLSSSECGPVAGGTAGTGALYACGRDRDSEAQQPSHQRPACGGGGPQRHCGQAGGHAAAASRMRRSRSATRRRAIWAP